MADRRLLKIGRDLWRQRARSLLVVAAVMVALAGAGSILVTWALVQRATELGYRASLPVSATLTLEGLDAAAIASDVRALPGIAAVRVRRTVAAAVQGGGAWRSAVIWSLADFAPAAIARLQPEGGAWPPPDGTLVIEKSSFDFAGAVLGETLAVKAAGASPQALVVAGVVRDVSLAPGWMEHLVYAYASPRTLARLGVGAGFDELQFRAADAGASRDELRRLATQVRALAERRGARVAAVDVPEPGQHIHAAQMDSLLLTQGAFGLLALLACALLVVNLVSAMLAAQRREIAVMKVLGAGAGQVAALTLGYAALLGAAATAVALPLAVAVGRRYAAFKGELLNFPVETYATPVWVLLLLAAVGCLLPVLAAAWPVRSACRATVAAALRDIGIVGAAAGRAGRWRARLSQRPLLLAAGNALRARQRSGLTMLALAVGGAVFLGAANLRDAVRGAVERLYAMQRFDATLRLADAAPAATLETAAAAVAGVEQVQAWRAVRATWLAADGSAGERLPLLGLPPAAPLLQPAVLAGRWLREGDGGDTLVVNQGLARRLPGLVPGAEVELAVDGAVRRWRLAGIVDSGPSPMAYTTRAALGGEQQAATLVVAFAARSPALQLEALQRLRAELAAAGLPVAASTMKSEARRVLEDHLLMVVQFLGVMGWVMIAVGGIGLASAMSLSVLERTREIGVMRTLGAGDVAVMAVVQLEGLVIVLAAWGLSLPLAVPTGLALAEAFGRVMFTVPARPWPGAAGAALWLVVMLGVSLLACAWPAWRAARWPAARALSYE